MIPVLLEQQCRENATRTSSSPAAYSSDELSAINQQCDNILRALLEEVPPLLNPACLDRNRSCKTYATPTRSKKTYLQLSITCSSHWLSLIQTSIVLFSRLSFCVNVINLSPLLTNPREKTSHCFQKYLMGTSEHHQACSILCSSASTKRNGWELGKNQNICSF